MVKYLIISLFTFCLVATSHAKMESVLLDDDFGDLPSRMFSSGVVGAQAEYHFLPAVAQKGNWQVSCFRSEESQRNWRVIADGRGGQSNTLDINHFI